MLARKVPSSFLRMLAMRGLRYYGLKPEFLLGN